jgi:hypothetical protein
MIVSIPVFVWPWRRAILSVAAVPMGSWVSAVPVSEDA